MPKKYLPILSIMTTIVLCLISGDFLQSLSAKQELEEVAFQVNKTIIRNGTILENVKENIWKERKIQLVCEGNCQGGYGEQITYTLVKKIDAWSLFLSKKEITLTQVVWVGYI